MKNIYLAIYLSALCSFCIAGEFKKITIFTSPTSYLLNFPLDEITEDQVIDKLGVPNDAVDLGSRVMWSYESGKGYGLKKYTFTFKGGVVVDVLYNDQGAYNGSKASAMQAEVIESQNKEAEEAGEAKPVKKRTKH